MTEPAAPLPWDQQPDEPEIWYKRFLVYRDDGYPRTLGMVYRALRAPHSALQIPPTWLDAFRSWSWRERANAWDLMLRQKKEQEIQTRKETEREQRILVLKASRGKLIEAMQKTEATDPNYSQIVADLASLNSELRKEYE